MKKFLLSLFILNFSFHISGEAQWTTNGPYGAYTPCVLKIGTDVYAGTNNGVYKTINNGISWTPVSKNLPSTQTVTALFYDGTTMYAGLTNWNQDKQVYTSNDMGVTWKENSTGLPAQSSYNGFCAIGTKVFVSGWNKIYYTTNSGASWTATATSPFSLNGKIYSDGTNLFALYYYPGIIMRSTDQGQSWQADTAGQGVKYPGFNDIFFSGATMYVVGRQVFFNC